MAYKSHIDKLKAVKKLAEGKTKSIPCISCEDGTISVNPDIPVEQQCTFYCDKCSAKIVRD